jgi:Ca2+-binding EF-hand superfamily protein
MSGLASSQINALKVAFDHCDKEKNGRISVAGLLDALHCLSYDINSKVLYSAIKELDNDNLKQEGVSFEQLLQAVSNKLFTDDKTKQIEKQFDLLMNNEGVIDKERIKTIQHEISRYLPDEEIDNIIKTVSSDEKEITLDNFTQKLIK